jgi:hypothetical protein
MDKIKQEYIEKIRDEFETEKCKKCKKKLGNTKEYPCDKCTIKWGINKLYKQHIQNEILLEIIRKLKQILK